MRIEAETRMKVIGTVWGSHGTLGGGGVAGGIWKKTYPVEPGLSFAFSVHVFPAEVGVGYSSDLRDAYAEVEEVQGPAEDSCGVLGRWKWNIVRELGDLEGDL